MAGSFAQPWPCQEIIKVRNRPSTVRKVTAGIFCWPTRSLHDAIKCNKSQNNYLSHRNYSTVRS